MSYLWGVAGDVVGVLYDLVLDTLSFFENGRCMGVAFEGVLGPHRKDPRESYGHLYPFVILEKSREQVSII